MAPNSGFQGGPFAQISSLGPVACGAAAGGISSLQSLAHPQASQIPGEVCEGTQAASVPVPAQDLPRVALLWAGAEAETMHPMPLPLPPPPPPSQPFPEAWRFHILPMRTLCVAGFNGVPPLHGNSCPSCPTSWAEWVPFTW